MYSPEPLSSGSQAQTIAYAFGVLYAHVLQATVTRDKINLMPVPHKGDWTRARWIVSAFDGVRPRAFELNDGSWLFAAQTLGVRESSREPGTHWLTTLNYTYRWQGDEDNGSWIVRWCYAREKNGSELPPSERAHVHVNATPNGYTGPHFPDLHLPSGRVAIEDVAAYLISDEIGCPTHSDRADEVVEEAREIFAKILRRA